MDAGLTVPTIFTDSQVSVQDNEGQSSHISDSLVANPVLVPVGPGIDMRLSPHFTIVGDVANQPYGDASPITGSKTFTSIAWRLSGNSTGRSAFRRECQPCYSKAVEIIQTRLISRLGNLGIIGVTGGRVIHL